MSDVVAAALIAAGVGVIGYVATVVVALITTGRQTKADADRLRDEHREADRRVRRDAYARMLVAIEALDLLTSRYTDPPTRETFDAWLRDFRAATIDVRLVESPKVVTARRDMGDLIDTVADEAMRRLERGEPMEDAIGIPYLELRVDLASAGRALGNAMRDDLAFMAH